jgi:hypothetical protein
MMSRTRGCWQQGHWLRRHTILAQSQEKIADENVVVADENVVVADV